MRSGGRRQARRLWSTSATLGEHDGSQGGGKGRIRGCTLQWRQTDEDCNNQLTMIRVHPQQSQEGRLRSCPHRGTRAGKVGGDIINCQLSAVVTVKPLWQWLGGERGQERHDCSWAGRVVACGGVGCLSCIISLLFPPLLLPLLFSFSFLPPPFSSFPPFFIFRLHYHEKKAARGSLIMVVEAIEDYNCLFCVGTQ
jgi:hypothetical protein